MVRNLSRLCVVLVSLTALSCAAVHSAPVPGTEPRRRVEISELAPDATLAALPVLPWLEPGDEHWKTGPPAWQVADQQAGTSAEGWLATTDKYILMKIVVEDNLHRNVREGGDIWDGDALQIGIDARGDGSGPLPPDTHMVNPDDASITVALTEDGTHVWAHFQGKYGTGYIQDGEREYACTVVRDEQTRKTTYEVAFPWEDFLAQPGLWPTVGLCVQVNDTDEGPGQLRLYWGRGADGVPRPGLHEQLQFGPPPHQVAAAVVTREAIWRPTGQGQIRAAVASAGPTELVARMGGAVLEHPIEGRPLNEGVRRFLLRGWPGRLPEESMEFVAEVRAEDGAVMTSARGELRAPGTVMGRLHERAEALVAESPHALFTRHLRSVDALVQAEWNRGMLVVDELPSRAQEAVNHAEAILSGLEGRAAQWDTYAAGQEPLVLARIAGSEQSLQYYLLTLPEGWDPEREYPLIVNLHGAGPTHPLFYVGLSFQTPEEAEEEPDEAEAEPEGEEPELEPHFVLAPWGRGNNGYGEQGEDDVWQALEEVRRDFRVDADRIYLTGHSMGGGGTWHIALRTPDVWAAACPVSGGTWGLPPGRGLGINAQHLPFRIWHGEADGSVSVDNAYAMQAELRRYGNEPDMVIVPDQGHGYPPEAQVRNHRWLLQHRRVRPDRFSYVADTDRHRGAWGMWMDRDVARDPLPRFDCRIEGNTVHISSEGTPGLDVDLGPEGLGMAGEVTVFWNGEQAYKGPPEQIQLGDGGGWRP